MSEYVHARSDRIEVSAFDNVLWRAFRSFVLLELLSLSIMLLQPLPLLFGSACSRSFCITLYKWATCVGLLLTDRCETGWP